MTRINLVPPSELYDQHLMAEFREIQHVPMSLQRSLNKKSGFHMSEIPNEFTLNNGHVKFFYDKGLYLANRFDEIKKELFLRDFAINDKPFRLDLFPEKFQNNWKPSAEDLLIIRARIAEKLAMKLNWYKKTEVKSR